MDKLLQHYTYDSMFTRSPRPPSSMLGHSSQRHLQKIPNIELGGARARMPKTYRLDSEQYSVAIICPPTVEYYRDGGKNVYDEICSSHAQRMRTYMKTPQLSI